MMLSEFVELTGFEPTPEEYSQIEQIYMSDPHKSKEDFCREFIESGADIRMYKARAGKISGLKGIIEAQKKRYAQACIEYEERIEDLEAELEEEQEWKPTDDVGTQFSEDEYQQLLSDTYVKRLSNLEAKDLIHRMFGFDRRLIWVQKSVHLYEINRHHVHRKAKQYSRAPLFEDESRNYIRFNCRDEKYEVIDGLLHLYNDPPFVQ